MMHEHAQTWSVLKTLYSSTGGSGTTSATLAPAKNALASGSHGSGGGLSTTGNPEPATGKKKCKCVHGSYGQFFLQETDNIFQRNKSLKYKQINWI